MKGFLSQSVSPLKSFKYAVSTYSLRNFHGLIHIKYQDVERGIKGMNDLSRCIECIKRCQDYQDPQSVIDCIDVIYNIFRLVRDVLRY